MKRVALYCRVSTVDQHPESQLLDLKKFVADRGDLHIVETYTDHGVSGTRSRRPALDKMLADARRHRFDTVIVWSVDRLARSTRHLLQVLDELSGLGIEFLSQREAALNTNGPLGRAVVVIVSAMAELERCIMIERVRAGMRRARMEGTRLGRAPLDIDRAAIVRDRQSGMSLTAVSRKWGVSRSLVCKLVKRATGDKSSSLPLPQTVDLAEPKCASVN
jgi:DNA invertase Pin-like site-specific DNA recombinase